MHLIKIDGAYVSKKMYEEIEKEITNTLEKLKNSKILSLELMKNRYETKEKNNK